MPKPTITTIILITTLLWGATTQATPPIKYITQTPVQIDDWYNYAYSKLTRAANAHVKGFDVDFGLRASTSGYDGFDNSSSERITATFNIPLYSRKERMRLSNERHKFMAQGLSLIAEARKLSNLLIIQQNNLHLLRAVLKIEGATAIAEYTKAQGVIIENQQRAWEVKALFEELVRIQ